MSNPVIRETRSYHLTGRKIHVITGDGAVQ
jgi:hypothetical protein